jgi:hypothetical protein
LASTVAVPDQKADTIRFIELARKNEWLPLQKFQGFRGDCNALLAYAVECPSSALYVLLVKNSFELYENDSVADYIEVKNSDSLRASIPKQQWQQFLLEHQEKS